MARSDRRTSSRPLRILRVAGKALSVALHALANGSGAARAGGDDPQVTEAIRRRGTGRRPDVPHRRGHPTLARRTRLTWPDGSSAGPPM